MSSAAEDSDSDSTVIITPMEFPNLSKIVPNIEKTSQCPCIGSSTSITSVSTCWRGHRICNECRSKFDPPNRCACRQIWVFHVLIEDYIPPGPPTKIRSTQKVEKKPDLIPLVETNYGETELNNYESVISYSTPMEILAEDSVELSLGGSGHDQMNMNIENQEEINQDQPVRSVRARCDSCHASIMTMQIFKCVRNHSFCVNCKARLEFPDVCMCTQPWSTTDGNNTKCPFESQGCPDMMRSEMVEKHAKGCKYRPISCNVKSQDPCDQDLVHIKDYLKHLTEFHLQGQGAMVKIPSAQTYRFEFDCDNYDVQISYVVSQGKQFLLHALIKDEKFAIWAKILEPIEDVLENYIVFVDFNNPEIPVKLNWVLPVMSPHVNEKDVVQQRRYMAMSTSMMMQRFAKQVQQHYKVAGTVWIGADTVDG